MSQVGRLQSLVRLKDWHLENTDSIFTNLVTPQTVAFQLVHISMLIHQTIMAGQQAQRDTTATLVRILFQKISRSLTLLLSNNFNKFYWSIPYSSGNITANEQGVASVNISDSQISLISGDKLDIRGRSLVVHEKKDDLGQGGNEESKFSQFQNRLDLTVLQVKLTIIFLISIMIYRLEDWKCRWETRLWSHWSYQVLRWLETPHHKPQRILHDFESPIWS